jgi:hypothetical protein
LVEGTQVRELPLNGRSFVQLTQLMPGVSPAANFNSKNKGLEAGVDFSVNGNSTTHNLFLVDGVSNNDVGSNRTILVYPSIDAIFRVNINSVFNNLQVHVALPSHCKKRLEIIVADCSCGRE